MTTLLIDADLFIHRAAAACQHTHKWGQDISTVTADFGPAVNHLESAVDYLLADLHPTAPPIMALSDPQSLNWRRLVYPAYKDNRSGRAKPVLFRQLREYVETRYRCECIPWLEGDDMLGLLATSNTVRGEKIIVSGDKDLGSVPGLLYNPGKPERGVVKVTQEAADRFHLMQTLTGDASDGYPGIPGVGPKKAEKILGDSTGLKAWGRVRAAYEERDLTENDALVQARVARILRVGEYSTGVGVKLWAPQ